MEGYFFFFHSCLSASLQYSLLLLLSAALQSAKMTSQNVQRTFIYYLLSEQDFYERCPLPSKLSKGQTAATVQRVCLWMADATAGECVIECVIV